LLVPPQSTNLNQGQSVTFDQMVAAGAPLPVQFQWRLNGINVPGGNASTFPVSQAGVTNSGSYTLAVGNPAGAVNSDIAKLLVSYSPLPFTNNFINRAAINGPSGVGSGSNTNATREAGEPNHAGKVGSNSVWLKWTAPAKGAATFSTRGSGFDTLLAIYTGTSLTNLTLVAADDDRGGFFTSETAFIAQAGTNYAIAIDGLAGAKGDIVLSWNLDTNITQIPRIIQQPISATVSPGGNATFTAVAASTTNLSYQWFFNDSLALPGATNAALTVSNIGPSNVGFYDVAISTGVGRTVRSERVSLEIGPLSSAQSRDKLEDLLFNTGPGGSLIEEGKKKSGQTTVPVFVPVSSGAVASQVLNNTGASTQLNETNHCGVIGGASKWFGLHSTDGGVLQVDTIGSSIDTVLAVYTNNPLNLLSPIQLVACDRNSAPDGVRSLVQLAAGPGLDYLVAVDSVRNQQGLITLSWRLGGLPVFTNPPITGIVREGTNVTLSAGVANTTPDTSYRWRLNSAWLPGATNALLLLTNVGVGQGGTYSVVVSNFAGVVTNTIATVKVQVPLHVSYTATQANGHLQFRVYGTVSQPVVLEQSSDLSTWLPVFTNAAPNTPFEFLDTSPTNSASRFYRAMPWP
jgi:hypothetical protein